MTRPQKILNLITSKTSNPTVKKLAFLQLQKELDIISKNPNATSRKTEIQTVYKQLYKIFFFQTNCDQISDKKLIAENLCLILDKFYDECCELDDLSENLKEEIDIEELDVEDMLSSVLVLANNTTTSKNFIVSGKDIQMTNLKRALGINDKLNNDQLDFIDREDFLSDNCGEPVEKKRKTQENSSNVSEVYPNNLWTTNLFSQNFNQRVSFLCLLRERLFSTKCSKTNSSTRIPKNNKIIPYLLQMIYSESVIDFKCDKIVMVTVDLAVDCLSSTPLVQDVTAIFEQNIIYHINDRLENYEKDWKILFKTFKIAERLNITHLGLEHLVTKSLDHPNEDVTSQAVDILCKIKIETGIAKLGVQITEKCLKMLTRKVDEADLIDTSISKIFQLLLCSEFTDSNFKQVVNLIPKLLESSNIENLRLIIKFCNKFLSSMEIEKILQTLKRLLEIVMIRNSQYLYPQIEELFERFQEIMNSKILDIVEQNQEKFNQLSNDLLQKLEQPDFSPLQNGSNEVFGGKANYNILCERQASSLEMFNFCMEIRLRGLRLWGKIVDCTDSITQKVSCELSIKIPEINLIDGKYLSPVKSTNYRQQTINFFTSTYLSENQEVFDQILNKRSTTAFQIKILSLPDIHSKILLKLSQKFSNKSQKFINLTEFAEMCKTGDPHAVEIRKFQLILVNRMKILAIWKFLQIHEKNDSSSNIKLGLLIDPFVEAAECELTSNLKHCPHFNRNLILETFKNLLGNSKIMTNKAKSVLCNKLIKILIGHNGYLVKDIDGINYSPGCEIQQYLVYDMILTIGLTTFVDLLRETSSTDKLVCGKILVIVFGIENDDNDDGNIYPLNSKFDSLYQAKKWHLTVSKSGNLGLDQILARIETPKSTENLQYLDLSSSLFLQYLATDLTSKNNENSKIIIDKQIFSQFLSIYLKKISSKIEVIRKIASRICSLCYKYVHLEGHSGNGNEKEISNLNTFSLLKFDNLKFSCKKFELQKPIKSHALLTLNDNIDFRPYQIQGINWLNFLNNYNLNGILADDMGLGKTLQVIASLAWSLGNGNELNRNNKNILIVCPSSLIYHWKSEFLKFTCLREEENFVLLDKLIRLVIRNEKKSNLFRVIFWYQNL